MRSIVHDAGGPGTVGLSGSSGIGLEEHGVIVGELPGAPGGAS
jgi:hypothetical protein